jgi:hypothetical protein
MKTIVFNPVLDELRLRLSQSRGARTKSIGRFKVQWTAEGEICALDIRAFEEELRDFRASLEQVKLGGMWKGVKITERDISEVRRDLWRKAEEDA